MSPCSLHCTSSFIAVPLCVRGLMLIRQSGVLAQPGISLGPARIEAHVFSQFWDVLLPKISPSTLTKRLRVLLP